MLQDLLFLTIGLGLLLGRGDILVRGASSLAKSLGVPILVIGLNEGVFLLIIYVSYTVGGHWLKKPMFNIALRCKEKYHMIPLKKVPKKWCSTA